MKLFTLILCLLCCDVQAGPFKAKPFGPQINYHLTRVYFPVPLATNVLVELDMSTNGPIGNYLPVAYYPSDGQWKHFCVSNTDIPSAFFRAKSMFGVVSNLMIVLE